MQDRLLLVFWRCLVKLKLGLDIKAETVAKVRILQFFQALLRYCPFAKFDPVKTDGGSQCERQAGSLAGASSFRLC